MKIAQLFTRQLRSFIFFVLIIAICGIPATSASKVSAAEPTQPAMIKDVWSGSGSSNPDNFFVFENKIYFSAASGGYGTELWVTDGSADGTYMIKDIWPGSGGSEPHSFHIEYGKLFFFAFVEGIGDELWVTDGTEQGTYLFKNFDEGIYDSTISAWLELSDKVYVIRDGDLWLFDENPAKLVKMTSFTWYFKRIETATIYHQKILFSVTNSNYNGNLQEFELWTSDGTTAGTQMFFHSGLQSWDTNKYYHPPRQFYIIENLVYFYGNDVTHGVELWRTDGTQAGTYFLKDTSLDNGYPGSRPVLLNGRIYYQATGGGLYSSDGTQVGTYLVSDVNNPWNLSVFKDQLFFVSPDPDENVPYPFWGLWKTDGTAGGTVFIKQIEGSSNFPYYEVGNKLILLDDYTNTIWESDGTTEGTQILSRVCAEEFGCYPPIAVRYAGKMYFVFETSTTTELWKSDGTLAGTAKKTDFPSMTSMIPGTDSGIYIIVNNVLYFSAADRNGEYGTELWMYDLQESPSPCDSVSEIPQTECHALVSLYESTNGSAWNNRTNWLETTTPSNWFGVEVTNGHIVSLNLDHNNLAGPLPSTIGQLSSLQRLDLKGNLLTGSIPTELASLSKLVNPGKGPGASDGLSLDYNRLEVPSPYPSTPPSALHSFLMQKDPDWYLTQAVSVAVDATGGEITSHDSRSTIDIPANAVGAATTLNYIPQAAPEQMAGSLLFAQNSFRLVASDQDGPLEQFTFTKPVTMTLSYTDADVAKIVEESLILYYWDTQDGQWKDASTTCSPKSPYIRDLKNNTLQVDVCHLTEFALFGKGEKNIYLPAVRK